MDNVLSKANGLLVGIIDIGIKLIAAGVVLTPIAQTKKPLAGLFFFTLGL